MGLGLLPPQLIENQMETNVETELEIAFCFVWEFTGIIDGRLRYLIGRLEGVISRPAPIGGRGVV